MPSGCVAGRGGPRDHQRLLSRSEWAGAAWFSPPISFRSEVSTGRSCRRRWKAGARSWFLGCTGRVGGWWRADPRWASWSPDWGILEPPPLQKWARADRPHRDARPRVRPPGDAPGLRNTTTASFAACAPLRPFRPRLRGAAPFLRCLRALTMSASACDYRGRPLPLRRVARRPAFSPHADPERPLAAGTRPIACAPPCGNRRRAERVYVRVRTTGPSRRYHRAARGILLPCMRLTSVKPVCYKNVISPVVLPT